MKPRFLGLAGSLIGVAVATVILAIAPRFLVGTPAGRADRRLAAGGRAARARVGNRRGACSSASLRSRRFASCRLCACCAVTPTRSSPAFSLASRSSRYSSPESTAPRTSNRASPKIAAGFTAGMLAAAGVLAGAATLLTRIVAKLARERVRVVFRHGLAALARPGAGTLPAVTALGLGVLVVVAIALVDRGLTSRLRADLPKDAPNVFLVDMQSSQWPRVALDPRRRRRDGNSRRPDRQRPPRLDRRRHGLRAREEGAGRGAAEVDPDARAEPDVPRRAAEGQRRRRRKALERPRACRDLDRARLRQGHGSRRRLEARLRRAGRSRSS